VNEYENFLGDGERMAVALAAAVIRERRPTPSLPEDATARNDMPMAEGLLDYFPNALAYVAKVSKDGNEQHNPGQALHWNRDVSRDHGNKIIRHQVDFDKKDERDIYHAGRCAWRALAQLQELLEREHGYPLPRGCRTSKVLIDPQHVDEDLNKSYGGTD